MTPDESRAAVVATASLQGLDPRGAVLLHLGPHHTWRLPKCGAIAKVWRPGTDFATAFRECRIGSWLRRNGIRTPRLVGNSAFPAPYAEGRYYLHVTYTEDLGDRRPSMAVLADVMRRMHGLDVPPRLGLWTFSPVPKLAQRITELPPGALSHDQEMHLRGLLANAQAAWCSVPWPAPSVIHGDPGFANCLMTSTGPALIDFERTSTGPALWDQAIFAWRRDVFGMPSSEFEEFVGGYGADVTTHDDGRTYRLLTPLFALTAWLYLAECARTEPELQAESDRRLATLLALPPFPWSWKSATEARAKATR
ncbi:phosphotransferase family protein [Kitasatospora sp. NBC_01300]|uniref:phosphotransferase family protein n=1 Tax=Kitasatospora sp. NBC_01300 TaxID=2903574 RepID=UPI00352BEF3D|nr:aminoglycoside phosphotransferase family protein [Kitasatospora sp. NBC_01300]